MVTMVYISTAAGRMREYFKLQWYCKAHRINLYISISTDVSVCVFVRFSTAPQEDDNGLVLLCGLLWFSVSPFIRCRISYDCPSSNKITLHDDSVKITGPTHELLSNFTVISDIYKSFFSRNSTLAKCCLTQWISKLLESFEIQWVRQ